MVSNEVINNVNSAEKKKGFQAFKESMAEKLNLNKSIEELKKTRKENYKFAGNNLKLGAKTLLSGLFKSAWTFAKEGSLTLYDKIKTFSYNFTRKKSEHKKYTRSFSEDALKSGKILIDATLDAGALFAIAGAKGAAGLWNTGVEKVKANQKANINPESVPSDDIATASGTVIT